MEQPTYRIEDGPKAALRRQHYAGDSLRELGILVLVFIPLETILQKPAYWVEIASLCFLVGGGLVLYGMKIQSEADVEEEEMREMEGQQ